MNKFFRGYALISIVIILGLVAAVYLILNPPSQTSPPQSGTTPVLSPTPTPTQGSRPTTGIGCAIGGCNSELCQDADEEPLASICIFRPEYVCYKSATCELQNDGKCDWTQTEELKVCLSQNQN